MGLPTYYCQCGREASPQVIRGDILYVCPVHGVVANPSAQRPQPSPEGARLLKEQKAEGRGRGASFPAQREPGGGRLPNEPSTQRNAQIPARRTGGMPERGKYWRNPREEREERDREAAARGREAAAGAARMEGMANATARERAAIRATRTSTAIAAHVTRAVARKSKKFFALMAVPLIGMVLGLTVFSFIGGGLLVIPFIFLAIYNIIPSEGELSGAAKLEQLLRNMEVLEQEIRALSEIQPMTGAIQNEVADLRLELRQLEYERRQLAKEVGVED